MLNLPNPGSSWPGFALIIELGGFKTPPHSTLSTRPASGRMAKPPGPPAMIDSFGRLFPTWYTLPPRERVYQQHIIVNWLEIEVEPRPPRRMPILNELRSWRNREIYYFIADGWDWTKALFETGQYFPRREDAPERFRPAGKSRQQRRHVPIVVPSYLSARSCPRRKRPPA